MTDRRQESYAVRLEAAELARSRAHSEHHANGDEQRYAGDQYLMSFTKGLPHNPDTGLLHDARDFVEFRRAIDDGLVDPFSYTVRHGAKFEVSLVGDAYEAQPATPPNDFRQWEAPTAGVVFDLQGPDAQAVTMPPAPALIDTSGLPNPELIFEIAEVYELAVLRDQAFIDFEEGPANMEITDALLRLNALGYAGNPTGRPRKRDAGGDLTAQTVFRGSSPGVEVGPYLSQFLLIGSTDVNGGGDVAEGKIGYGALAVEQKVPIAEPGKDYMTTMDEYVAVQRGLRPAAGETYGSSNGVPVEAPGRAPRRFLSTPRDLATYVHYDALYEAYLNACLVLLGMGTPSDPSCDHLSGVGAAASNGETRRNAAGFALYGGPHILTLVTEVATRALKAVRFQKFNSHIRLRPEALAARIELDRLHAAGELSVEAAASVPQSVTTQIRAYRQALEGNVGGTLGAIAGGTGSGSYFLPMAFPEGSPMHPAYGAGHATVAGACVTLLKAFFDTGTLLAQTPSGQVRFKHLEGGDTPVAYRPPVLPGPGPGEGVPVGDLVAGVPVPAEPARYLTLEGELNKLAANISIGRNMAGVHYFSDYYDSLRMGEQIALGLLEEQALGYPTDPFVLSVPTFDGRVHRIGRR